MEFRLTSESMELLIESIVDAVESTDDRDMQFELAKTILKDNGIVEIKDDEAEYDYSEAWEDGSEIGCSDCPDSECTGHCMSCPYRPV